MERFKVSVIFWVLLVASLVMPGSAQQQEKKQAFQAKVKLGTPGTGNGLIISSPSGYSYDVHSNPSASNPIATVTLTKSDLSWPGEIELCGPVVGPCNHDANGYLSISGSVSPMGVVMATGLSGGAAMREFRDTLRDGNLLLRFEYGTKGEGPFVCFFGC